MLSNLYFFADIIKGFLLFSYVVLFVTLFSCEDVCLDVCIGVEFSHILFVHGITHRVITHCNYFVEVQER